MTQNLSDYYPGIKEGLQLDLFQTATGTNASITANGTDANIGVTVTTKGTGSFKITPASTAATTVVLDLSSALGSQPQISFVASTDTNRIVANNIGTTSVTGYMKVFVAGTARFIPFFT